MYIDENGFHHLTKEELIVFESFFQYGNYETAKYIFVGKEEGLDGQSLETGIKTRLLMANDYKDRIQYLQKEQGITTGWYTYDETLLRTAQFESLNNADMTIDEFINRPGTSITMNMQKRMAILFESPLKNNLLDFEHANEFKHCGYRSYPIHSKDRQTAMFDFFPLPKQGAFRYKVKDLFSKESQYYSYYMNNFENKRARMIKYLYDHFPMNLSFVYTGIQNGKFRALKFYEEVLKFSFEQYSTGEIPKEYQHVLQPKGKPKNFLIGYRNNGQIAVLSPFWGPGSGLITSYNDIDILAAWAHVCQMKYNIINSPK